MDCSSTDRGHLMTEQRLAASTELDQLSIAQTLELINAEDASVAGAVRRAVPALSALVTQVVASLRRGGRLLYVGAGTSGRLGVLDASECPPTFFCDPGQVEGVIAGGDVALRTSTEGAEDDDAGADAELTRLQIGKADVVVGLAAGGTTPYVLGALRRAKERGAATGLICCVDTGAAAADSAPLREGLASVDHVIELLVGPEVVTGSTRMKAGTATKLALNMITTTAMVQLGKTWGNLMVDLRASNAKLRDRATRIISSQCDLSRAETQALLDRAGGRVKVALVMARRGLDAAAAEALLEAHDQKLGAILGPPR